MELALLVRFKQLPDDAENMTNRAERLVAFPLPFRAEAATADSLAVLAVAVVAHPRQEVSPVPWPAVTIPHDARESPPCQAQEPRTQAGPYAGGVDDPGRSWAQPERSAGSPTGSRNHHHSR